MGMKNEGLDKLTYEQQKLVEDNIKLVYLQAHKRNIYDEDLIQEGMLALVNAARFYSPEFGVKFSTYAASYIWAALFDTYSNKKYKKNQAITSSLDDEELDFQPSSTPSVLDFMDYLNLDCSPLAKTIVEKICSGFSKREIKELLNISDSQLNSILNTIGRENYAERGNFKHSH